ncbi:transposase [Streptomyces sp. NPDC001251]
MSTPHAHRPLTRITVRRRPPYGVAIGPGPTDGRLPFPQGERPARPPRRGPLPPPLAERVLGSLPPRARRDALRHIAERAAGREPEPVRHDWDWMPVRRALADAVYEDGRPLALAARAAVVPCAGVRDVGAEEFTDPRTGRRMAGRRVVGLWLVTARGSVPVDRRLMLTPRWLEPGPRQRAGVPDDAPSGGSVTQGIDMAVGLRPPGLVPLLLDARRAHVPGVLKALRSGGLPYVLRVSGSQFVNPVRAVADGPAPDGFVTARQAAAEAADRGGSVLSLTGRDGRPAGRAFVRLDCRTLPVPGTRKGRMVLLAEQDPHHPARGGYWLTNLTGHSTAHLLRLVRLPEPEPPLPAPAGAGHGHPASYGDWHRHTTLDSVARAAVLLAPSHGAPRPAAGRTSRVA